MPTYYVSTTGDNTAAGTTTAPFATIGHGINQMASGDTLIVKAGTYLGSANFINSLLNLIPSGTALNPTTIKAETPLSVVIRNSGTINYYDNQLRLEGNYINVDGFVFDFVNIYQPEYNAEITGNFNKVTNSLFRREGDVSEYGGWVAVYGDNNLVEDSAGVGAARYGFVTGGPTLATRKNIFRRVVARVDYTNSTQPKAAFAVYGNNNDTSVQDHLFQNCIAIDGRAGPNSSQPTYGGFYFPKNATRVTVQGSIVLNNEAEHSGIFAREQNGHDVTVDNTVVWGTYGSTNIPAIRIGGGASGNFTRINNNTIGANPVVHSNLDSAPIREFSDNLLFNNGVMSSVNGYGWTSSVGNITETVSPQNILKAHGTVGADVTVQYGVTGTLWGEAGFDQVTTAALWPWRNEDEIKQWFSVPNTPPAGNVPSANSTVRGFTAASTLTTYVWEYLGTPIPAEIYGSAPPPEPAPAPAPAPEPTPDPAPAPVTSTALYTLTVESTCSGDVCTFTTSIAPQ